MKRDVFEDCAALFDMTVEGRLCAGWDSGVLSQRTKTTKCGPIIYAQSYPIWDTAHRRELAQEMKKEKNRLAARKSYMRRARETLEMLLNLNFGEEDVVIVCEYRKENEPADEEEARRGLKNYLLRLKRLRQRRGLEELKAVYWTEETESAKWGKRYHHTLVVNGKGLSRDEMEKLWQQAGGGICNTRRCQYQSAHLSGLAGYLFKNKEGRENPQRPSGRRKWSCTRNIRRPSPTTSEKKISVRRAGRIAQALPEEKEAVFAKLYPGCQVLEVEVKKSEFAGGVYIRAKLRDLRWGKGRPDGRKQKAAGDESA